MKTITIRFPLFYKLFKKIYRERLEEDLRSCLGYWDFVETNNGYGSSQSQSWETFMNNLFQ
jgi:hypothetical protein